MHSASRKTFLDLLRILACFFVIVNHTNSNIFMSRFPDDPLWLFSLAYFFLSKSAVPIFIMISGYLLLGKVDSWKKNSKRIIRMLIVFACCSIFYAFFYGLLSGESIGQILMRFCRLPFEPPSNALWYLYAYIGILIMLPFLQKMNSLMEKKDYYIVFGMGGFFSCLFPILTHYGTGEPYYFEFHIPLFSSYILMLFIGQYFAKFGIKRSALRLLLAFFVFLASLGFCVGATYYEYTLNPGAYLFYDHRSYLPIVLIAASLFYIASYVPFKGWLAKGISYVGACTFGIYLISDATLYFVAEPLNSYLAFDHGFYVIPVVLLAEFGIFAVGLIITAMLRLIPGVKKIL